MCIPHSKHVTNTQVCNYTESTQGRKLGSVIWGWPPDGSAAHRGHKPRPQAGLTRSPASTSGRDTAAGQQCVSRPPRRTAYALCLAQPRRELPPRSGQHRPAGDLRAAPRPPPGSRPHRAFSHPCWRAGRAIPASGWVRGHGPGRPLHATSRGHAGLAPHSPRCLGQGASPRTWRDPRPASPLAPRRRARAYGAPRWRPSNGAHGVERERTGK